MTISFMAGRRIQGLSTDIVETPTFEDDFSSDNWTDKDSTNIGVSGGTLTGENVLDGGDDTSYYDLTSTSDTNWILRFKGTSVQIVTNFFESRACSLWDKTLSRIRWRGI